LIAEKCAIFAQPFGVRADDSDTNFFLRHVNTSRPQRRLFPETLAIFTALATAASLRFHSFSHSNHRAVLFERNFVHERPHEVKSAPVSEKQSLDFGWIGDRSAIKALSLIPHGDQYLSIHAAAAGDVNLLLLILVIAMNHRVGQSLIYGNFNPLFGLFRRDTLFHEKPDESHKFIYE
jgi:hypothetical protein